MIALLAPYSLISHRAGREAWAARALGSQAAARRLEFSADRFGRELRPGFATALLPGSTLPWPVDKGGHERQHPLEAR